MHGLWPERRDGTWPQFCAPGDDLNVEEIADLVPEMERVWPSWSSDDEAFWNHEWARHGTCAMSTIRGHQHRFFETVLRLHDLEMDLLKRRATRAGKRLDLSAKEFNLLALFFRRPGEVLSRP